MSVRDISDQSEALTILRGVAERGIGKPLVRQVALEMVNGCKSRDDLCEIEAVFNAVKSGDRRLKKYGLERGFAYRADPINTDFFTGGVRSLKACAGGACGGDCLPGDTSVLGAGYTLRPISEVLPGDTIMGDGVWTTVTKTWDKGVQQILEFKLSNGCVLRCTSEHRVFRVPRNEDGYAGSRETAEEVRAGDLKPGDDLLTAAALPYGVETMESEKAWLLGVHVADGWVGYDERRGRCAPVRVGISGKDGHRKEAQKVRAKAFCDAHGISSRWDSRYLSINDAPLAEWLAGCGRGAVNKHVPSLNWTEPCVTAILEGLAADTELRDGVFGTVSPTLALQYRLLLKMQGISAHISKVEHHGGLGKNPIFRVTPRRGYTGRIDPRKWARVKSISDGGEDPTFDIEVENHRFYLPETDLIVHNCDDHSALLCGLLGSLGFTVGLRAWGPADSENLVHVYAVVGVPKNAPSKLLGLDTTHGPSYVGWEPPKGRVVTTMIEPTA